MNPFSCRTHPALLAAFIGLVVLTATLGYGQPPPSEVITEKVRLAPRPIPGMGGASDVPVAPFIPPTAVPRAAEPSPEIPPPAMDMERARIVQIQRRGTITLPATTTPTANPIPTEADPAGKAATQAPTPPAEGKVRIIPRELVTPAPTKPEPAAR